MSDTFDFELPGSYKGFDLSEFDESELPELLERIDYIHGNMMSMKELCKKMLELRGPTSLDLRDRVTAEGVKLYGEERGKELSRLVLGKTDQSSFARQIATARAFQISYERQFEDEESEPIDPFEFEESDVFKIMQKLTGGENPLPDLLD